LLIIGTIIIIIIIVGSMFMMLPNESPDDVGVWDITMGAPPELYD